MTRLAQGVFAALVVATFAAFFVAQNLKTKPNVIAELGVSERTISPNNDGRFDYVDIGVVLRRDEQVDLTVIDAAGDTVRRFDGGSLPAGERFRARWRGETDAGGRAKDGTYRLRLGLRREGRSLVLPRTVAVDTQPPKPRVLSIGPDKESRGPELVPTATGAPADIRFFAPGTKVAVEIWKTDSTPPRRVTSLTVPEPDQFESGVARTTWDGTRRGRAVSPGTYAVVVRSRDSAGNIGWSIPERVLRRGPRRGEVAPGRGGITVRYLGVEPSLLPVQAGKTFSVAVDARGGTYNWRVRRVGEPNANNRGRRATGGPLVREVRGEGSSLQLFEASTRTRTTQVPIVVDDRRDNRVLVVLPATTWQGRNLLDDDGDGLPNTLDRGTSVRLGRVFARGLPEGFAENEGPTLAALQRQGLRFDLTTDVALAAGRGPKLDGHRGVLLPGDTRWLTQDVRRALRGFVAAGGTLASFGTESLRAQVRQTPRRLLEPTPLERTDLFGARLGGVKRESVALTNLDDAQSLQLFAGGEGLFPDVEAYEPTVGIGSEAQLLSSAVTQEDEPEQVIVATKFGKGLVIRTGIPGFATRIGSDQASAELFGRIWTLLRTGSG